MKPMYSLKFNYNGKPHEILFNTCTDGLTPRGIAQMYIDYLGVTDVVLINKNDDNPKNMMED